MNCALKSLPVARGMFLWATCMLCSLFFPTVAAAQDMAPDPEVVSQFAQVIRWSGVITSIAVVAAAWVVLRFTHNFVEGLSEQFASRRLLFQKIETVFQFFLYVGTGAAVMALSLRLDSGVLAVIGGTVAVSVGFAVKDVVASFIAGIMIMMDRPFQVGDRVEFGGQYGDISTIGLRSVRMQTLDDNTVTIPNNKFLNELTSCGNYGALDMQVGMNFYVGIDQDIERAQQILREAAVTSRYVHLPKPIVILVNQSIHENYVAVHLRLKAYVADTRFEKAFVSDVNLRAMKAFRKEKILPPAMLHRNV